MTVARMKREVSAREFGQWVALWTVEAAEAAQRAERERAGR